jgi:hypothetical protein
MLLRMKNIISTIYRNVCIYFLHSQIFVVLIFFTNFDYSFYFKKITIIIYFNYNIIYYII